MQFECARACALLESIRSVVGVELAEVNERDKKEVGS